MEIQAKIVAIGEKAQSKTDPLIILFGESASESLREVACIQQFSDLKALDKLVLKKGDSVKIDDYEYTIDFVGALVQANLQTIQHANLFFKPAPKEDRLENGLYLLGGEQPSMAIGTIITYIMKSR